MVSPLFDSKNRPKEAVKVAEGDFGRLEKARRESGVVVISHETCPGLFLLARERLMQAAGNETPVSLDPFPSPRSWNNNVTKIHLLIPAPGSINFENGSQIITVPGEAILDIIGTIRDTLIRQGFEVVLGAPTRFERADVI